MSYIKSLLNKTFTVSKKHLTADTKALFFLSTGCTGTTTVARSLKQLASVKSCYEPKPKLFAERQKIYLEVDLSALWIRDCFIKNRSSLISKAGKQGLHYVGSSGYMAFFTPWIGL